MFGSLPKFHLSNILSKLQCADGLWNVGIQGTDVHKHASLGMYIGQTNYPLHVDHNILVRNEASVHNCPPVCACVHVLV